MEDPAEIERFFEIEMPGPETRQLFDKAKRLGIGFSLGYAELTPPDAEGRSHRFNTSIIVDKTGEIVAKYRKIHLPGHAEYESYRPRSEERRVGKEGVSTCRSRRSPYY